MRAPLEERYERVQRLLERVAHESELGSIIVVEGQRDLESLRRLGVTGRILCLQSSRRNTFEFVEALNGSHQVIVLTDFDREGVFLAKRLGKLMGYLRIPTNLTFWRDLKQLTKSDIRSIQELPKLYHRFEMEYALTPQVRHAYEMPVLRRHHRAVDERRLRLARAHKTRKKTGRAGETR